MSEEKSSPIGITIIVVVAAIFVGSASGKSTGDKEQASSTQTAKPAAPAKKQLKAPFIDPLKGGPRDIEARIRIVLKKPGGEISGEDMIKLSSFDITSTQASDLSPIMGAVNVESLNIRKNQISDLSALVGMKKLKSLVAYSNRIADLSPLAGLTNLRYIALSGN